MPLWAQPSRLVGWQTFGLHYRAVGVPVLDSFLFVSSSNCRGECDCEHSSWSSSKSLPGQQTPGISSHTRHPVCESCSFISAALASLSHLLTKEFKPLHPVERMIIASVELLLTLLLLFLFFVQPASAAGAQVVHAQQRAVTAAATPAEVVAIATGQGVRAVTPVTTPAVVSTTLSPVQSQTRPLVTQVTQGNELNNNIFHVLVNVSTCLTICCSPPSCRYAVATRKAPHPGPPADAPATTAATATAGCLPTDQSCRQTPGTPLYTRAT